MAEKCLANWGRFSLAVTTTDENLIYTVAIDVGGILDGVFHGVTLACVKGDSEVEIDLHIFVGSKAA